MTDEDDFHKHAVIADRQKQDLDAAYSFVLSTEQGRAFLFEILNRTGWRSSSFTGDPLTTAFNEGRRSMGVRLFDEIFTMSPGILAQMEMEYLNRAQRYHVSPTQETEF